MTLINNKSFDLVGKNILIEEKDGSINEYKVKEVSKHGRFAFVYFSGLNTGISVGHWVKLPDMSEIEVLDQ